MALNLQALADRIQGASPLRMVQGPLQAPALQSASRKAQLLAAMLLPFFVVACFAFARVVKEIIVEMVPTTFPALNAVAFILGVVLLIVSCAACFAWVKTGGFRLFD